MTFSLIWQIFWVSAIVEGGAIINNISNGKINSKEDQSSENDGIVMSLKPSRKDTLLPRQGTSSPKFKWCSFALNELEQQCVTYSAAQFGVRHKCSTLPEGPNAIYSNEFPLKCKLYESPDCTDYRWDLFEGRYDKKLKSGHSREGICCWLNENNCNKEMTPF